MNSLFGIPMSALAIALVAMLGVCLLFVLWVGWRRPVIFKLGLRNIPRRKAQTILIVVGLMLSTLIISAALGTGDTMDHSLGSEVYRLLGSTDELVVASQDVDADALAGFDQTFPASELSRIEGLLQDNP